MTMGIIWQLPFDAASAIYVSRSGIFETESSQMNVGMFATDWAFALVEESVI